MIKGITLKNLRNPEYAQLMTDVLELVNRNDPTAMKVEEAYNLLKTENDELTLLLNPDKGSVLTALLEAADDRRDLAVSGINLVVSGYINHFDPTLRTHAEALQRNLGQYGGASLARENYQSETAGISSMLMDWTTKPELTAAITALNLDSWKDELSVANKAFNDLFITRTEEASTVSPVKVREKRLSMMKKYYELRDLIVSYHTIFKGAAPYSTTVSQLNILIEKYNTLLAARKGKSGNDPHAPAT